MRTACGCSCSHCPGPAPGIFTPAAHPPYAGRHADPAQLVGLVLDLLDPHAPHDELPVPRRNDLTFILPA